MSETEKITIPEYFLHSRHGDSFHFRKEKTPDSIMESFTVSYIWDGTCVISGDYGDLTWQRSYYKGPEYCFPFPETGIGYFAEKVHNGWKIKEWSLNQAIEEIKTMAKEADEELSDEFKELLQNIPWWEHEYEMQEDLNDIPEFEDVYDIGIDFTWHFRFQFEVLKSVSQIISTELKKAEQAGTANACEVIRLSETEKKLAELESKIKDEMNEWIHAEHEAEEQGRTTQRIYCRGKVDGLSRAAFILFEACLDASDLGENP